VTGFIEVGAIVLTISTLIIERIRRGKSEDTGKFATNRREMGIFYMSPLSNWAAFWMETTERPRLTTIRGIIEAGDYYTWSSAALDQLLPYHSEISWLPLFTTIFTQIAKRGKREDKSDSGKGTEGKKKANKNNGADTTDKDRNTIKTFLTRAVSDDSTIIDSANLRDTLLLKNDLVRCIRPLDVPKDKPNNGPQNFERSPPARHGTSSTMTPEERQASELKQGLESKLVGQGLTSMASAWMLKGKPCIETSREELFALSLILGIPLKVNDFTQNIGGIGPFGTGLDVVQDNGVWKLELHHGSRLPRHASSCGSGYTSLFAKHLAFGSLPFADSTHWIQSVYVNDIILDALKEGRSIKDGKSFGGHPLQMLKRLPGAKQIDAFYHTSERLETDTHLIGRILKSNGDPISLRRPNSQTTTHGSSSQPQTPPAPPARPRQRKKPGISESEILERKASSQSEISSGVQEPVEASWCRAVVGIAFGGLVPQASFNLAKAVEFTVGREICDCIDELENLINRLHLQTKHLNLFGAFISERASTEEAVDHVFYATPSHYMDTQEATASFARYMNLVERMAAQFVIVPPSPQRQAVGNPNWNSGNPGQSRQDMLFEASCDLVQKVYVEAVHQHRKEMEKTKITEGSEGAATTTTTIVEPTASGATRMNLEPATHKKTKSEKLSARYQNE
jgi:hypothetical protein